MLTNYEISIEGVEKIIANNFKDFLHLFNIKQVSNQIYEIIKVDVNFVAKTDASQNNCYLVKNNKSRGIIAIMCYRIANFFYYCNFANDNLKIKCRQFMEQVATQTGIDIHPQAQIDEGFFIDHGNNIIIGATCVIGKNCTIFNNVILGSNNVLKNTDQKRHPTLGNNVTVCAGAKIFGNIEIGDNVFVCPNAVVTDNIESNTKVSIVNQLQITKQQNKLPSEKLVVFAVVPKFKNSIKILGDGFYNPTILIKMKSEKELNYDITYWDKNKVIIKFKPKTYRNEDLLGLKIVILSNSEKVILLNSFGLKKALLNLVE